ncbi:DNA recombination protein RmuC [Campylobacter corcagiensis]|uniref:DNA recombination protein RmuC n=1 Tax=Campylobacter corcagiensis TaxID=1448857 RepID=UPI001C2091A2|nr:DNA recombination protein RmuC [Campylobacter corcagiensis]
MIVFLLFKQKESFDTQILSLHKFMMESLSRQENLTNDMSDTVIDRFFMMSKNINQSLMNAQTNSTNSLNSLEHKFSSIVDKMAELKSSNSSVTLLKDEIIRLNRVFSNPKLRGNFGEFELEKILRLSYGENSKFYELQKSYPSGVRVDAAIKIKNDLILPIDSKFPLTNYLKIFDDESCKRAFLKDIKKHINDISTRYITPPKTTEFAVMFLPSEAVFGAACDGEILEFAYQKGVFLASPTTLMALLYSVGVFLKDEQISKNATVIKKEIFELSNEFIKFKKHSRAALSYATKLREAISLIEESSQKLSDRFDTISKLS